MIKANKKRLNLYIILLLIIGFIGIILFFPVNFNNSYTCIYHRFLNHHNLESDIDLNNINHQHNSDLLDIYINHYALFWWLSISLLPICFIILKRSSGQSNKSSQSGGCNVKNP